VYPAVRAAQPREETCLREAEASAGLMGCR